MLEGLKINFLAKHMYFAQCEVTHCISVFHPFFKAFGKRDFEHDYGEHHFGNYVLKVKYTKVSEFDPFY